MLPFALNHMTVARLGYAAGNLGEHATDQGYKYGYGRIQQEVLLPAFLSAYTEKDLPPANASD